MKANFYEVETGELIGIFKAPFEHSSYPGRLHGGIAAAIIDETIGRTINIHYPEMFSVTLELTTKFKKPIPIGEEIKVIARLTSSPKARIYEGTAQILLNDGEVAVEGHGKNLKLPLEKIAKELSDTDEMRYREDDVKTIET